MTLRLVALLAGLGVAMAAAGCGGGEDSARAERSASPSSTPSGSGAPSPSTTRSTPAPSDPSPSSAVPPPTAKPPTGPPKTPTDRIKPGWVVGTIAADSGGPCYRLITDEGVEYALHSSAGFVARKGQRLRVQVGPMLVKMYCGPGRPASASEFKLLA
jgi:hypothetical protein